MEKNKDLTKICSNLDKIDELREVIKNAYVELNKLEKEVIELWTNDKSLVLESKKHAYQMLWIYEKEIDYEELEKNYPEIYILGLRPSFSKEHLFHSVSVSVSNEILRKHTYDLSRYKLKKKGKKKNVGK